MARSDLNGYTDLDENSCMVSSAGSSPVNTVNTIGDHEDLSWMQVNSESAEYSIFESPVAAEVFDGNTFTQDDTSGSVVRVQLTPSERQSVDNNTNISLCPKLPQTLPQAGDLQQVFSATIQNKSRSNAQLLTRLFYAIGSPLAFLQLRSALRASREATLPKISLSSDPLVATVEMLDQLDSVSEYAHILRRFLLIRLVKLRQDRESIRRQERAASPLRKLRRHDPLRIEAIKQGINFGLKSPIEQKKINRQGRRADSEAMTDLLNMLYPNLQAQSQELTSTERKKLTQVTRRLSNRLACGRNWFILSQSFSSGILALIPRGSDARISIDQ